MKKESLSRAMEINEEIGRIDDKIAELENLGDVNTIHFKGSSKAKESTGAIQIHTVSKPTEGDLSVRKDSKYAALSDKFVNGVINELKADKAAMERAFEELP